MDICKLKSLEETFNEAIKGLYDLDTPDLTVGIRQTLEEGLTVVQTELHMDDINNTLIVMHQSSNPVEKLIAYYATQYMESENI
jgi:SHS2 domain-containing protein